MLPSKEQERKALEQIKKILKGLGNNPDNSYVCMAFDGCVEDAESNIENDFADSYRSRYEYREAECERLEEEVDKADERAKEAERRQKMAEGLLQTKAEEADKWLNLYNTVKTNADTAKLEAHNGAAELQRKVEEQELEIIKLKAKLYDMMVGA